MTHRIPTLALALTLAFTTHVTFAQDASVVPPAPANPPSVEALARQFGEDLHARSFAPDTRAFDDTAMAWTALDQLDYPSESRRNQARVAVITASRRGPSILRAALVPASQVDAVIFRGLGTRDGRGVARYRLEVAGTRRWVDVVIVAGDTGGYSIRDAWVNGEWVSDRYLETILATLASDVRPRDAEVARRALVEARSATLVRMLREANAAGDSARVLELWNEATEEQHASWLAARIVLDHFVRRPTHPNYAAIVDAHVRAFPDDGYGAYVALDRFANVQDFPGMEAALGRLLGFTGDDEMLLRWRANAATTQGAFDRALGYMRAARVVAPSDRLCALGELTLLARLARFDDVGALLDEMRRLGIEPEGLHDAAVFAAFRGSEAYRRRYPRGRATP